MDRQQLCSSRWPTFVRLVVVSSMVVISLTAAAGDSKGVPHTDRLRKLYSELNSGGLEFQAPVTTAAQRHVHPGGRRNLADSTGELEECPIDLSDLSGVQLPILNTCSRSPPPTTTVSNAWPPSLTQHRDAAGPEACCDIVHIGFNVLQGQWTDTSRFFRVENETVLRSCIREYVRRIADLGTGLHVETCFSDSFYKYSSREPSLCGPKTVEEFTAMLENSTVGDSVLEPCNADLLESLACATCHGRANTVLGEVSQITISRNATLTEPDVNVYDRSSAIIHDCLLVTAAYAAIAVDKGTADPGVKNCLYTMQMYYPTPSSSGGGSNRAGLAAGVSVAGVMVLLMAASLLWWRHYRKKKGSAIGPLNPALKATALQSGQTAGVTLFTYEDLQTATDNFSEKNHIGSGGFGSVYKGVLPNGTVLAVKRLKNFSSEGETEFLNEVEVINRVRHRNLVRLRGCCVVGSNDHGKESHQRLLVYDFLPGGSLTDHLFPSAENSATLSWPQRSRIAVRVARGLAYLHNDTTPPIFHRDIKPANVLLDDDFNPRVADFGLARLTLEGQSHITASTVAGTHGYMAPEYAMYGKLTDKSDVYSFGVLLLEIMSGRKALDTSQIGTPYFLISDWCWTVLESPEGVAGVIDERIRERSDPQVLSVQERFVIIGMLCSYLEDAMRPTMAEALIYLEGDRPVPRLPSKPVSLYSESSHYKKYLEDSTTGPSGTISGSFSAAMSMGAKPR